MKMSFLLCLFLMTSSILIAQDKSQSQNTKGSKFLEKRRKKMIEIRKANFDAVDRNVPAKEKQEEKKKK